MNALYEQLVINKEEVASAETKYEPPQNVAVKSSWTQEELSSFEKTGLDIIFRGAAGVVVLAGGQGSRLGFEKPKGMFDIGLPSHKSLF